MKTLWKALAKIAFYAIALGLMGYAAMRTLHFIQATLPADQQILGYLALLATSGGAVAWLLVFLHAAEGVGQKAVSFIMVLVCLLGEFALFAFDTLLVTGEAGLITGMSADEIRAVVIGMSGLIAANIGSTVAYHLLDTGNMRHMREEFVKDRLESEAMKLIEKRGEEIARDMAPKLAEQWAQEFEERFKNIASLGIGQTAREKKTQPVQLMPPLWFNKNGKSQALQTPDGPEEGITGYYRILINDENARAHVVQDFTPATKSEFEAIRKRLAQSGSERYAVWSDLPLEREPIALTSAHKNGNGNGANPDFH